MSEQKTKSQLMFSAICAGMVCSQTICKAEQLLPMPWSPEQLQAAPDWIEVPEFKSSFPCIKAIFFRGLKYGERSETRVFAWLGIPPHAKGQRLPGMVLIHGGGGTASDTWVKLWNDRGYIAIALDTCGCVAGGSHANRPRHADGGPAGCGGFSTVDRPINEQWPYHAVADIILANSLLRALADVDPDRIGVTGISWGGYLTCIAASVDSRFCVAIAVYGCGFYQEPGSRMRDELNKIGEDRAADWMTHWDASQYLGRMQTPILWISGTNDAHFPLTSLKKSFNLPSGYKNLCLKLRLAHSEEVGQNQPEAFAFAESIIRRAVIPSTIANIRDDGKTGRAEWHGLPKEAVQAELVYTVDVGNINQRAWTIAPATLEGDHIYAALPENVSAWYFNVHTSQDLIVSSEPEIRR